MKKKPKQKPKKLKQYYVAMSFDELDEEIIKASNIREARKKAEEMASRRGAYVEEVSLLKDRLI